MKAKFLFLIFLLGCSHSSFANCDPYTRYNEFISQSKKIFPGLESFEISEGVGGLNVNNRETGLSHSTFLVLDKSTGVKQRYIGYNEFDLSTCKVIRQDHELSYAILLNKCEFSVDGHIEGSCSSQFNAACSVHSQLQEFVNYQPKNVYANYWRHSLNVERGAALYLEAWGGPHFVDAVVANSYIEKSTVCLTYYHEISKSLKLEDIERAR